MKKIKALDMAAGIICAAALILAWLFTSVEIVAYGIPGYYEKEYTKYNVLEDVDMEMDDLLYVTGEMMDYLRGDREDLHVMTVVGGQPREFFNDREIAHMEDVQGLFLGALKLRRAAVVLAAALIVLIYLRSRKDTLPQRQRACSKAPALKAPGGYTLYVLARSFQAATALIAAASLILGLIMSTDFTKYFTIFHLIFFNNDLWLLDPATDLLINIVPEPFFMDTALYIGLLFGVVLLAVLGICTVYCCKKRKNRI